MPRSWYICKCIENNEDLVDLKLSKLPNNFCRVFFFLIFWKIILFLELFLTTNLRPGHGEVSLSIKPGMAENHDKVEYYAKKTYSFVIQSTLSPDFLFTLPVHQEACLFRWQDAQPS